MLSILFSLASLDELLFPVVPNNFYAIGDGLAASIFGLRPSLGDLATQKRNHKTHCFFERKVFPFVSAKILTASRTFSRLFLVVLFVAEQDDKKNNTRKSENLRQMGRVQIGIRETPPHLNPRPSIFKSQSANRKFAPGFAERFSESRRLELQHVFKG